MVEDVKQLVNGGGFKTQAHDFKSREDVSIFVKTHLPAIICYENFPDICTMLSNCNSGVTMGSDIERMELHTAKVACTTP